MYLPTKKIGKNNPKAAEIEADNTARQEWNRTADLALVSGIEEAKILEIKQTEIHDKAGQSIRENGWLPNLFRSIVGKAKEFLQAIIREKDMPPKPVLDMDMDEFRTMQTLMLKVQKQAKAIKKIQEITLPNLLPSLFTIVVLSVLNAFKVFREAYLVAGDYPQEKMYLLQHLFNNWYRDLSLDKMSAAAVVTGLVIFLLILGLWKAWGKGGAE